MAWLFQFRIEVKFMNNEQVISAMLVGVAIGMIALGVLFFIIELSASS
tara:strand:+ start:2396 stop:2539 length:144 start_codon:yes stop_codon:yes gene_type:complete